LSLPWFRLYHQIKDDPKIGKLPDSTFRTFIEALCWACQEGNNGCTGILVDAANWAFRRDVTRDVTLLNEVGYLSEKNGRIFIPKWDERQKASDSGAERMRRFRNRVKTSPVTHALRNGDGVDREGEGDKKEKSTPNGVAGANGHKRKVRTPESDEGKRIANLFNRRLTTAWSEKEISAFKKAQPILPEDLDVIESYYAGQRRKGDQGHHRRDLPTFLNNYRGELDRATAWKGSRHNEDKP
jgi:hypothetical protein